MKVGKQTWWLRPGAGGSVSADRVILQTQRVVMASVIAPEIQSGHY